MKNMIAVLFTLAVVLTTSTNLVAQTPNNVGACPGGNYTYIWTGNAGQVPSSDFHCPTNTNPGVIGMTMEIRNGRPAQEGLDQRRAVAASPSDWDGRWCTLAVTSIGGEDSVGVACVPRWKFDDTSSGSGSINAGSGNTGGDGVVKVDEDEKFYHKLVERGARVEGCVVQSLALQEAERSGVGQAGLTRLALAVSNCIEWSTADVTPIALALIKGGMNGIISTSSGALIIEKPYRYDEQSGNQWYHAVKWTIPPLVGGLAGYAGGGMLDPESLRGGIFETGAQWKLGLTGVAVGLFTSLIWELADGDD